MIVADEWGGSGVLSGAEIVSSYLRRNSKVRDVPGRVMGDSIFFSKTEKPSHEAPQAAQPASSRFLELLPILAVRSSF